MSELSVYKQMTAGTADCLRVIRREIGMKTTCAPFAVKLMEALSGLTLETAQEELHAANVLLSGLQTLMQGGIVAEDYDKIDFVKRGGVITPSARVEAFLRAAARKGYRITDTIVAVPQEDYETTFFKEVFSDGDIVYILEDARHNADRAVTAQRLIDRYFAKFICRLDIREVQSGKRVAMTACEMSLDDLMTVVAASEQGIYKSKWVEYNTQWGKKRKKVLLSELNEGSFWVKWTGEMVNKTIIRRALKRVKEVLPELHDSIYAFERDDYVEPEQQTPETVIDIPIEYDDKTEDVNLHALTEAQQAECLELYELCKANPKLAEDKMTEICAQIEAETPPQEIINREYAALVVLARSKQKWEQIGGYFDGNIEKNKA